MNRRLVGIFLSGIGMLLLLFGLLTNKWASAQLESSGVGVEVSIGLVSLTACTVVEDGNATCKTMPYETSDADQPGVSLFVTFGSITLIAGLAAALLALLSLLFAAASLSNRALLIAPRILIVLCAITTACGVTFHFLEHAALEEASAAIGIGFFATLLGSAAGGIGGVVLARVRGGWPPLAAAAATMGGHPVHPSSHPVLGPGPASTPALSVGTPVPACSQCGAPTRLVAEYQRYYCDRCRFYL